MTRAHTTLGSRVRRGIGGPSYCAAMLVTLCLVTAGCQTTVPHRPTTRPDVPLDSNSALMNHIADQPFVTVEPAYRAAYILWQGDVYEGDFAALSSELEEGRIVGKSWDHPADAILDRASAGYLICRAAGIRSGLNWQLTGLGRYAWRELIYQRIVEPSSEYGYVPGGQYVGMLAKAEEHIHRHAPAGDTVELGAAP